MAATTADAFAGMRLRARLRGSLVRLGGVLLIAGAVALAVALYGFDWRDPSLNQATSAGVQNPTGLPGAYTADLLYQLFGLAAWLPVVTGLSWGLRLALGRMLRWPWLPVLGLPLALLALAAFLAVLPPLPPERWPLQAGLGGAVGDLQWRWFEPMLGSLPYAILAGVSSLLLVVTALGVRLGEGLWAAGKLAAGSLWVGRRLGDAAGAATLSSGRMVRDGWRGMELGRLRRPTELRPEPEQGEEAEAPVRRARRRVVLGRRDEERREEERPAPAPKPAARAPQAEPVPTAPAPGPRKLAPSPEPMPAPLDTGFELPGLDLLAQARIVATSGHSPEALAETSRQLETVLDDFGVRGEIIDAKTGPVVTLYELEPAPGTRAARVISLADDIARSLCALSVRVAVVPGRNVIGIELPNERRATVYLRELLEADVYAASGARLPIALGKDISGQPIVADLARMPHLLIAGTTGSGKSVAINAMILSLLYRLTPEQLRLIMIDPKVIELSVYEDIPHLLAPVVTDPPKAVVALKWVVRQMDERYRLMSHLGVRDIFAFNKRLMKARADGEELKRRVRTGFEPGTGVPIFEEQPIDMTPMPLIVVIVDEVADLMLTAGKEIENAIQRLSQKARAAGIHLVVATQRPSVDVLTGVIKANLPSRISFRVSSKIDSRTILGEPGAEQLLGQGDMLYLMPGDRISRIHGALVTDAEVEQVVRHLKTQGEPDYHEDVTEDGDSEPQADGPLFEGAGGSGDGMYDQAVQTVARDGKASTSYLQRKLAIGYNTAAKLIERMENEGLISRADHVGRRHVLMGRGGVDGNQPTDDPF
ncbi:MAG: DNA translocase FtsK 4TM domain-containing protein [Geminicoccaceae bacterium]